MNRREFLKSQIKGAFLLSLGSSGILMPTAPVFAAEPYIAKVKGPASAATRAAVDLLGGIKAFVKPGDRVVIKPNMSFNRTPEQASNTHPDVIRELVILCKEAGAGNILILDHTLSSPQSAMERSGIKPAVDAIENNIVFSANNYSLYNDVPLAQGDRLRETQILKEVLRSDVLIAAPVAKSHSSAGVSLSMKGMMGLIWDRWTLHRQGLDAGIVDICTVLKADLTVIDGSRVLSTNGPNGPGKVLKEDTIIASRDMVAADACAVASFTWYGRKYRPSQVGHIREAHQRGLGRMDIENLAIKTLSI
jgi:uncharacterized protein (DUF362 family)